MRASAFVTWSSLIALGLFGCSESNRCTPGMSIMCTCATGTAGAQVCASDGTYGACQCAGFDAGTPRDSGAGADASSDVDGGPGRDASMPSCGEAQPLSFGPGIPTNMGASIATVADIEGDERLEIVAFRPGAPTATPTEVRIGTWSGTALDGPSRQLVDLTGLGIRVVAIDDSKIPTFVGVDRESGSRVAYRYGASGYETIDVRVLPEPPSGNRLSAMPNGMSDIYGHSYSRVLASRRAWAVAGLREPWYRLDFDTDRVSAEQVDHAALFGSDMIALLQIDGDRNADGIEDFILTTNSDFWITESAPGDTWTRMTSISREMCESPRWGYRFALVSDLDRDGVRDLVLNWNCTTHRGGYVVALATDDGYQLIHHSLPEEAWELEPVALGDLDGDCYPDVIFSNGYLALNDGDGRFADPVPLASESPGLIATVVDIDFDGDNDLVWAAYEREDGPIVQLNQLR